MRHQCDLMLLTIDKSVFNRPSLLKIHTLIIIKNYYAPMWVTHSEEVLYRDRR